jgi:hypothetical protein
MVKCGVLFEVRAEFLNMLARQQANHKNDGQKTLIVSWTCRL